MGISGYGRIKNIKLSLMAAAGLIRWRIMEIVAVLDNIRSLHNVGAIFRTADGAGVKKIYLCGITPDPLDKFGKTRQQLTKVSLGAEESVGWEHILTTARAVNKLKKDGFLIYAVEQDKNSIPYNKLKAGKADKIALILGEETKGLKKSILGKADKILEIPMNGKKESLNVGVAFGIVVFNLIR